MGDCKPAPPLADLMIRISKDYESDMGSLHYMLDCIASLQTSASRVVVASQLGLFVAMQHNKSDEDRTRCQGSFPVDELERVWCASNGDDGFYHHCLFRKIHR